MKTIIIIGGGFAGLSAAKELVKLNSLGSEYKIVLFDKNIYATAMPSLPDLAGDVVKKEYITRNIQEMLSSEVEFKNEEITKIDLDKKQIVSKIGAYDFEYLIIASGSVTNYYGFCQNLETCHNLDSVDEALKIQNDFTKYLLDKNIEGKNVLQVGAGYTGMELAFGLNILAEKLGKKVNIHMVERAKDIVPFLTENEKKYIKTYLEKENMILHLNNSLKEWDGKNALLEDGTKIENAFFVWTAGSKFSIDNFIGKVERINDGRIIVSEALQVPNYDSVFAVGDSAAMTKNGAPLRKGVNYAVWSGALAGKNIIELIKNKNSGSKGVKLKKFNPPDLGWVIPLKKISVGRMFGTIPISGRFGLFVHFTMCGFRNFSCRNFLYFLKKAVLG